MNIHLLNVTKHKMVKGIFAVVFTQWLSSRRMSINYSPVAPYYMQAFVTSHIPSWEQLQRPALAQQQGLRWLWIVGVHYWICMCICTLISRYEICQYEPTMLDYHIYGEYGNDWKEGRWWQDVGIEPTAVGVGEITPFNRSLISYVFSPTVFW